MLKYLSEAFAEIVHKSRQNPASVMLMIQYTQIKEKSNKIAQKLAKKSQRVHNRDSTIFLSLYVKGNHIIGIKFYFVRI